MKHGFLSYKALGLMLLAGPVMAFTPSLMITHNNTDVESNAYIAGIIPSPSPTKARSTNSVPWIIVKIACNGHTVEQTKCPALIKMGTDTSNPVELGKVTMDIKTGEITPKYLSANGYSLTVIGPGEASLDKA